jgi:cytochrome c-type biogenesis protein CcmH/NrfF
MLEWIIPLIVLLGAIWIVYIVRNMQKEKDEITNNSSNKNK